MVPPTSPTPPHTHTHSTHTHHPTPKILYYMVQLCLPSQSDAAQNSYQVCLTVSSALCRVANLSYVPNFIMSSSALRNFNYIALNWHKSWSAILLLLINSPGQVKFSICNSNWPQCKRRQRARGRWWEGVYPVSPPVLLEREGGSTKHAFHANYSAFPWTNKPPIYLNELAEM